MYFFSVLILEMEATLPNGIVVDINKDNYKFYYKPIRVNSNKKTSKQGKYKCYLHVALYSRVEPQHIHIHDLDCKARGEGKGDGRFLFCEALKYLKTALKLSDATRVSLTAISVVVPKPGESPRAIQDKLIGYYKKYGFETVKEDQRLNIFRTDMVASLKKAIDNCTVPVSQNKRSRLSNMLSFLRGTLKA
jgi:hypothetical protein